ncbi:MAG: hypothetical protein M3220_15480, partial [Chloroflexota bacterium]|nr:hypothetical protein [Chloroflexota bacterium]
EEGPRLSGPGPLFARAAFSLISSSIMIHREDELRRDPLWPVSAWLSGTPLKGSSLIAHIRHLGPLQSRPLRCQRDPGPVHRT